MVPGIEALIKEAVVRTGSVKTAGSINADLDSVVESLEKHASDPVLTDLMKSASQSIRGLMQKVASQQENIERMEKMSSIRSKVDTMLDAGVISRYDVKEKVAEMVSDETFSFSGSPFDGHEIAKVASEPLPQRSIFSSVLQN